MLFTASRDGSPVLSDSHCIEIEWKERGDDAIMGEPSFTVGHVLMLKQLG